jgi:hypothetical protein
MTQPATAPPTRAVQVRLLDRLTATVVVDGVLDAAAVTEVGRAIESAAAGPVQRMVVDLDRVTGFTGEAPAALHTRCRPLRALPGGLALQAESATGRAALLATLLAEPGDVAPGGSRRDETLA